MNFDPAPFTLRSFLHDLAAALAAGSFVAAISIWLPYLAAH